jgi:hypothetical protein
MSDPMFPKKLSFRVSGARLGSEARPADATTPILTKPRFGLKVHASPLAKLSVPILPDDYATAEDYE